jgi:hypothetical protein
MFTANTSSVDTSAAQSLPPQRSPLIPPTELGNAIASITTTPQAIAPTKPRHPLTITNLPDEVKEKIISYLKPHDWHPLITACPQYRQEILRQLVIASPAEQFALWHQCADFPSMRYFRDAGLLSRKKTADDTACALIRCRDADGATALVRAVLNDDARAVQLLLAASNEGVARSD